MNSRTIWETNHLRNYRGSPSDNIASLITRFSFDLHCHGLFYAINNLHRRITHFQNRSNQWRENFELHSYRGNSGEQEEGITCKNKTPAHKTNNPWTDNLTQGRINATIKWLFIYICYYFQVLSNIGTGQDRGRICIKQSKKFQQYLEMHVTTVMKTLASTLHAREERHVWTARMRGRQWLQEEE